MLLRSVGELANLPQRIVSLVPSQTELLFHLGVEDRVIGVTKFCVHPGDRVKGKIIVGGTKGINVNRVVDLVPDLVIANKEENVKEEVEELARHFPVWVTEVNDLPGAVGMIQDIGQLTGSESQAHKTTVSILSAFDNLPKCAPSIRTAYLIWRGPFMAAGGGTFINDMLDRCGLLNIFAGTPRYPPITIKELTSNNCRLLLLSSEPYPFNNKQVQELQQQLPGVVILLVDGEMFSWYGSRLLHAPSCFQQLLLPFVRGK